MVTTFPAMCPNLQSINLQFLTRGPMIAAATGRRSGCSPIPQGRFSARGGGHQAIHRLSSLRELSVIIEGDPFLPPLVLPNLPGLIIKYDDDSAWLRMFRAATLGKLESVTFHPTSEIFGDFLEAFEKVSLAASARNTFSWFYLQTSFPWNPNYSSLLQFTQPTNLIIEISRDDAPRP